MAERLAVDLGNSRIATGHFKDTELVKKWYHPLSSLDGALKKIDSVQISSSDTKLPVIISSVVPSSSGRMLEMLKQKQIPHRLIKLDTQKIIARTYPTMGTDRLANLAAAHKIYGEANKVIMVLDFGTATTISAVDEEGNFLGGLITLGLKNTLTAVNSTLEQLPILHVTQGFNPDDLNPLSTSTEEAILNGTILGHLGMVESWLKRCRLGVSKPAKIIATGGLAKVIAGHIDGIDVIDEDLTLRGINLLGAQAEVLEDLN